LGLSDDHDIVLAGKTIGVVGVGHVGTKVCRAAEVLGMNVLMNDPPRERIEGKSDFVDLELLLKNSDVVTMHVPLQMDGPDRTFKMVDSEFLSKMKNGSVFINSSRGEVVDEKALKQAVIQGKLKAVVLDVFGGEPNFDHALLDMPGYVTPHIAGYSIDGKANGTMMSVRAVSKYFGLGLDTWEPTHLPEPEPTEIYLDASNSDMQSLIAEACNQTYDIRIDDLAIRKNPGMFEELRGNYRLRREPHAFSVRIFNGEPALREKLEALGFSVIGDSCF
jgi:erythronate-4-phosphate dehydrogenase